MEGPGKWSAPGHVLALGGPGNYQLIPFSIKKGDYTIMHQSTFRRFAAKYYHFFVKLYHLIVSF